MMGSRAPRSTPAWLLLAAAGLLLVAAFPPGALGQPSTGDSPAIQPAGFSIQMDRDAYQPGDAVVASVTNHEGRLEGNFSLTFVLDCDAAGSDCSSAAAGSGSVNHVGVHQLNRWLVFEAGETKTFTWDQLWNQGGVAPRGEYFVEVSFHNPSTEMHAIGPPFLLQPASTETPNTPPAIKLLEPGDGMQAFSPVQVRFFVDDDRRIARVLVQVDGRTLSDVSAINHATYEHDKRHELAPGKHTLRITAWDVEGLHSSVAATFNVHQSDLKPVDGTLSVSTDRHEYGPRETVAITLRNDGNETLSGTPQLAVHDENGRTVWSPAMAQVVQRLPPGGTLRFQWDQRTDEGHPAAPGGYGLRASFGGHTAVTGFALRGLDPAPTFSATFTAPPAGSGQEGSVKVVASITRPGATKLALTLQNGEETFEVTKAFDKPFIGQLEHVFDLRGVPAGQYALALTASGPGGDASDRTWIRIVSGADGKAPELTVVHPAADGRVLRTFPVVFSVNDDVGIHYAEAYLDGKLVARHGWPQPVMRGGFPVELPMGVSGPHELEVVVYDTGRHRDSETLRVQVTPTLVPCLQVAAEARAAAAGPASDGAANGAANGSTIDPLPFDCPVEADRPDPIHRGDYRYEAQTPTTMAHVEVRGKAVFDRIQAASERQAAFTVDTDGRFLVTRVTGGGELQFDLDGTWFAIQRGRHVMLENTEDGTQVLLVIVGGSPDVLGKRLVTELGAHGRVVARPLGAGPVEARVSDAILNGQVGAEVHIPRAANGEAVSYAPDMNVTLSVEGQRIAAIVSSEEHRGRTVVFTVDDPALVAGKLEVLIDGQPIRRADSLEAVLAQLDPEDESLYYVVQDAGETKVIVAFNHFSTRELLIQAAGFVEPFLTPLALVGGIAIIGAATLALFRREDMS